MPRLLHGTMIRLDTVEVANAVLASDNPELARALTSALRADLHAFGYLFLGLQNDDANLLPTSTQTRDALVELGLTMRDPGPVADPGDSPIPAAYTYFGQFVDHDITLEATSSGTGQTEGALAGLLDANLAPLALEAITDSLRNLRTGTLDLDTVYGPPAPRDGDEMELGIVTALGNQPPPLDRPPRAATRPLPRPPAGAAEHRPGARPRGPDRRPAQRREPHRRPAARRVPARPQRAGAPGQRVRAGAAAPAPALPAHRHPRLPAGGSPTRRSSTTSCSTATSSTGRAERGFFLPLEYHSRRLPLRAHDGAGRLRLQPQLQLQRPAGHVPGHTRPALHVHRPERTSSESGQGTDTLPENWIIEWENLIDAGGACPSTRPAASTPQLVEPLFELRNLIGRSRAGPRCKA